MKFEGVFRKGSQTFYGSSKMFPESIREEVTILYAFVRKADDFVDKIKQDKKGFFEFKNDYFSKISEIGVVAEFKKLEEKYSFKKEWTRDFLKSMEQDLVKKTYQTINETEEYIYGSANVIGLYMAKLMGLPEEANQAAELMGKSFQFVNFIRDVAEDVKLGRNYFPQEEMKKFGLRKLDYKSIKEKRKDFENFIKFQVERYKKWQEEAEKGYKFIPKKYLVSIKTAADLYRWTAKMIYRDPMVIFKRKVKPGKVQIWLTAVKNQLFK